MLRATFLFFTLSLPLAAVIPVAADGLIAPAHYFDLQGKTLRFTPSRQGYVVTAMKSRPLGDQGKKLGDPDYGFVRSKGWRIPLSFEFSYAGVAQHEIFVNSAGNLTFDHPEAQLYGERDTWPDGTVTSVAGSLNDRAAAGQERMICVLWGLYSPDLSGNGVWVRRAANEFVVTWRVERYIWFGEGYRPLGLNVFQARLQPDGVIEFTYEQVAEKDGIVGLFYGGSEGFEFDTLRPQKDDAPDPRLKIRSVSTALTGRTLRLTFQMAYPVARNVQEGTLWYRVFLERGSHSCEIGFEVSRNSHPYLLRECTGVPGFRVQGDRLDLYVSTFEAESILSGPANALRWNADVLWGRRDITNLEFSAGSGVFHLPPLALKPLRFSTAATYQEGNVFEVFHYPSVSKNVFPHTRYIYQHFEPQDDMAVVLTDFRIDDLHNHQGSTGAGYGTAIQGIGSGPATLYGRAEIVGSAKLQVATGPIYLGPRFEEFLADGDEDVHYRNYANAVGWMAHELTHRWGMELQFRNPENGTVEDLAGPDGHWSNFLNTPSVVSVWRMFADKPYAEKSQMEGYIYEQLPNGTFHRLPNPWNLPTGFSALDLYAMGLIGPDEVPDTFLVENLQLLGPGYYHGKRVPVRIRDVIAANGERRPGVRDSQKEFTIGIYLLHPGNRPAYAEKVGQAEGIEKMLMEYFHVATGGRMRLVAAHTRKDVVTRASVARKQPSQSPPK